MIHVDLVVENMTPLELPLGGGFESRSVLGVHHMTFTAKCRSVLIRISIYGTIPHHLVTTELDIPPPTLPLDLTLTNTPTNNLTAEFDIPNPEYNNSLQ